MAMKRSKKFLFLLLTFALPFLLLLLVEVSFRMTGLFQQEPLFLEIEEDGRYWYKVNADVANRYFDAKEMAVPKIFPDRFYKRKPENTIRIFCLGGSTTAGFPFEAQVPFPFQLKKMLQHADPEHEYEVINLGLSAVNSFTVLDFLPDILKMEPDLLVLYMGHNEFFGAYGSASTISIGSNGALIRIFLNIQKWRIAQAMKAFVSAFSDRTKESLNDKTLMEKVIADQSIPYDSEIYRKTLDNFRENLTQIAVKSSNASVPLFIGNLVSNVRDMPPMESLLEHGRNIPHAGEHDSVYLAAQIGKNDSDALLHFQMGHLLINQKRATAAATAFYKAKDLDALRFRASEDLNRIISAVSEERKDYFVNVKKYIEQHSEYSIPGNDLFCDHLHPNPKGYTLMAQAYATAIKSFLGLQGSSPAPAKVQITDLDWEMGLIKIYRLFHRWPFADKTIDFAEYQAYGDSLTRKIAHDYVYANHNWPQSHYDLAARYLAKGQIQKARNQYIAVSEFYPDRASPFQRIAETFMSEGGWPDAEPFMQKAIEKSQYKGLMYRELSTIQWRQGKIRQSVESIQQAIVAPELTRKQKAEATYQLATYLVQGRRHDDARRVLMDALRFNPAFTPAKSLLEKLPGKNKPLQ